MPGTVVINTHFAKGSMRCKGVVSTGIIGPTIMITNRYSLQLSDTFYIQHVTLHIRLKLGNCFIS